MKTRTRVFVWSAATVGLLALSLFASVWVHFRTTPSFREWARAHPASDDLWRAQVLPGRELARTVPWRSAARPAGERRGQWAPHVTIAHGDEVLLDLELDVSFESREVDDWLERGVPSEAFEGLAVSIERSQLDPDFRAVAVLTVQELSHYEQDSDVELSPQGPSLKLDVFGLAGHGDVEVYVQDVDAKLFGRMPQVLGDGDFARVSRHWALAFLGDTIFADDPPEEGIAYHVHAKFFTTWTQTKGGASSAGRGPVHLGGTTKLYSASLRFEQSMRAPFDTPGKFPIQASESFEREFSWQGEAW